MDDALEHARRIAGELVGVPAEHVALFWKGRVGLYAVLRALGIGRGDEVIVPAFTCVVVSNAVLYTGARPVYVDVDEATYTPDPAAVAAAATSRTRAIIAQNTFGLSSDLDALAAVARRHGASLIDDATHGLGAAYRGRPGVLAADAAFYSTQWSKPVSTGLGGIAATADPQLAARLRAIERWARSPTRTDQVLLALMVLARERVATPRTLESGRAVYRRLSRARLVPGSSSADELARAEMPPAYLSRMSGFQAELVHRRLRAVGAAVRRRRSAAERYSRWLASHGRTRAFEPAYATHGFLRYAVRVRRRDELMADAHRRGVPLGDWFHSPLYPVRGDLAAWGYRQGTAPVAERVSAEIVNLPTDIDAGSPRWRRLEGLLADWVDAIA